MAETLISIPADTLGAFVTELFHHAGLNAEDAAFHAGALVQTDLWGIGSHGVLRAPIYVQRVRSGAINAAPNIHKLRGGWRSKSGTVTTARASSSGATRCAGRLNWRKPTASARWALSTATTSAQPGCRRGWLPKRD